MEFYSSSLCSEESAVDHARHISIQGTESHFKFKIHFNIIACHLEGFDSKAVYVELCVNKVTQGEVFLQISSGFPCQYYSTNAPY